MMATQGTPDGNLLTFICQSGVTALAFWFQQLGSLAHSTEILWCVWFSFSVEASDSMQPPEDILPRRVLAQWLCQLQQQRHGEVSEAILPAG